MPGIQKSNLTELDSIRDLVALTEQQTLTARLTAPIALENEQGALVATNTEVSEGGDVIAHAGGMFTNTGAEPVKIQIHGKVHVTGAGGNGTRAIQLQTDNGGATVALSDFGLDAQEEDTYATITYRMTLNAGASVWFVVVSDDSLFLQSASVGTNTLIQLAANAPAELGEFAKKNDLPTLPEFRAPHTLNDQKSLSRVETPHLYSETYAALASGSKIGVASIGDSVGDDVAGLAVRQICETLGIGGAGGSECAVKNFGGVQFSADSLSLAVSSGTVTTITSHPRWFSGNITRISTGSVLVNVNGSADVLCKKIRLWFFRTNGMGDVSIVVGGATVASTSTSGAPAAIDYIEHDFDGDDYRTIKIEGENGNVEICAVTIETENGAAIQQNIAAPGITLQNWLLAFNNDGANYFAVENIKLAIFAFKDDPQTTGFETGLDDLALRMASVNCDVLWIGTTPTDQTSPPNGSDIDQERLIIDACKRHGWSLYSPWATTEYDTMVGALDWIDDGVHAKVVAQSYWAAKVVQAIGVANWRTVGITNQNQISAKSTKEERLGRLVLRTSVNQSLMYGISGTAKPDGWNSAVPAANWSALAAYDGGSVPASGELADFFAATGQTAATANPFFILRANATDGERIIGALAEYAPHGNTAQMCVYVRGAANFGEPLNSNEIVYLTGGWKLLVSGRNSRAAQGLARELYATANGFVDIALPAVVLSDIDLYRRYGDTIAAASRHWLLPRLNAGEAGTVSGQFD